MPIQKAAINKLLEPLTHIYGKEGNVLKLNQNLQTIICDMPSNSLEPITKKPKSLPKLKHVLAEPKMTMRSRQKSNLMHTQNQFGKTSHNQSMQSDRSNRTKKF